MRSLVKPITLLLSCVASTSLAGVLLQPVPAPEWQVSGWLGVDPGSLGDHRGRVVLIGFFHPSCPESLDFSLPLFRRWSALYGDREDLVGVLIHAKLQGRDLAAPERLATFVRDSAITWPVGIGANERGPTTAERYGIDRTPHLAIVDKRGMLRFTHAGTFEVEPVEGFIDRLLEESADVPQPMSVDTHAGPVEPAPQTGLSGTWVFQTEQGTGVCATWIPRMEVAAKLRVYRDAIDIAFVRPLLGMNDLEVSFDAETGRVEGESGPIDLGASRNPSNRLLLLEGVLDRRAEPPELEFELTLPQTECSVRGRALAEP